MHVPSQRGTIYLYHPFPIMSSHTTTFPISAPQSTDHHSILVKCHSMGLTAIRYGWTAGKTKAVMDVSIQLLPVLILKLGLHGVRRRVHCFVFHLLKDRKQR